MTTKTIKVSEATRDQLYFYAKTILGLDVHHSSGLEKVLGHIREVEPEITEIQVEDSTEATPQPSSNSAQTQASNAGMAANSVASSEPEYDPEEKVRIMVPRAEGKDGKRPIFLSVNGRGILVPRGEPVPLARKYLEVLSNAVQTQYEHDDEGNVTSYEAHLYPFSIL